MQFSDLTGRSVQADRRNTDMERIRKKTGIIRQVARLFAADIIASLKILPLNKNKHSF
jgi:hypothetical protein